MPTKLGAALRRRECIDCGLLLASVFDYYMVHNAVWSEAGLHQQDECCLGCLERRLGRPLTIEDFPPVPVNRAAYAGAGRLAEFLEEEEKRRKFHEEWERRHFAPTATATSSRDLRAARFCKHRSGTDGRFGNGAE